MLSKSKIFLLVFVVAVCWITTPVAEAQTELTMYYPVAVRRSIDKKLWIVWSPIS